MRSGFDGMRSSAAIEFSIRIAEVNILGVAVMAYAVDLDLSLPDHEILDPQAYEGGDESLRLDMEIDGIKHRQESLAGCISSAVPVPSGLFGAAPTRIVVKPGKRGYLPDFGFAPWGGWGLASRTFVDIVEQLESGVHQFLPIAETVDLKGRRMDKQFFLMNILQKVDAVDAEHSSVKIEEHERWLRLESGSKKYTLRTMSFIPAQPRLLVLKRAVIAGKHLWRDKNSAVVRVGFSDALFDAVNLARLSPLQYLYTDEI